MKCSCPTKFDDHSRAVVRASLDQSCPIHGARTQALPHCSTCTCGVGSQIVQTPAAPAAAQSDEVRRLREALVTSRKVLVVACGEKAPFVRVALDVIDAALGSQP
jgi:hypothetical protein